MKRQQSLRVVQHDEELLPRIQVLKAEYPFQGHLRILAYWRSIERWPVQKKRIWRLMWEHHLLVPPNLRQEAKPTPQGGKRKPSKRNQWWGIDMTKRLVGGVGWASIVIVLEWVYKGGREPLVLHHGEFDG